MIDAKVTATAPLLLLGAMVGCAVPLASQEPAPQLPLDAAKAARVTALVKDLELPTRRKEAMFALGEIGSAAAPLLDQALAAAATRLRPDVLAATQTARQRLRLGAVARALDLPAEPVTLIADYSDNRVVLVDAAGRPLREIRDVFGAWDAELLDNGNVLITEFSVSRVQEIDLRAKGGPTQVWVYEDLKNPYDADRLPDGNTLIADT